MHRNSINIKYDKQLIIQQFKKIITQFVVAYINGGSKNKISTQQKGLYSLNTNRNSKTTIIYICPVGAGDN